ncbi:MAG TPA: efflux RND transporter permease subunit [Prolixibacteraceae bacterium]|jgi:multidrug efflux pump subunit AcrB/outer membrane protein TolC
MGRKYRGLIEGAMRNRNIVIIITAVFMMIGVVALKKMPRNEFPQFTIRQGVIVGVYPGATSAEVEAQLTRVVENYIFGYQEVRKEKTYSQSKEGIMYIFVELNDNVKNADQFWSKLKHGLSELKMNLPTGVLALVANSDFGDTSALLITLSSDSKTYKELEQQLKKLEAECRKIPATSKIKHFGLQKEKIFVNVKPELLNEYNIKSLSLLGSYQSNGMVSYAGELKDGFNNLPIHFPANFESERDLADQIVYSDPRGNVVRLKNIASIERRYDDPKSYIRQNGKKTILLSLEMQPGNNIVEFGEEVDAALATFQKQCPADIEIAKISELPKYVDDSISNFMKEFLIAIIAVILVTMILLPMRVASVAGITVPISVLITLSVLYFIGVELHTVSLATLILVLGMIVDNSIVVIDNHVEKIDHGYSPWYSAIKSAKELVTPIITATLAILAAYIPLGFMIPGTPGEFMNTIPIVVFVALTVSIVIALLLVPYLNFLFIKKGLRPNDQKKKGRSFLDILQGWFDRTLERAFVHPKTILAIGLATILLAVGLFTRLDQQLFPELERNQFAVEVYLPTGASIESTAQVVDSLETILLHDQRVTNVTSFIGTSSPRFHTVYAPNMPASNYGQLLINTQSDKATREIVNEYSPVYSDHFANAHVKWKILALQVSKSPIEVRISTDSVKDICTVEAQVYEILKKTPHLGWVRTDWDQMQQNVKVSLDRDKANRLGYSKGLVATSLMIGLDGIPLTTIWENDYPVEVRLSQEPTHYRNLKTLEDQYITSFSNFSAVPLRSFATFTPEWTQGTIVRRNGTPTLTIQIENDPQITSTALLDQIKPQIDQLVLPEGTSVNYGGDLEAQKEVFTPMTIALGLSIILIFFILLFEFKKVRQALLIMSTMLLSLPGAAIGLTIMHYPFSITAFIGITSLCGMVVRNGIILIDYARELRERDKLPIYQAAIAAGKRRMRPIFLTSAAASVGVIPMILSRSPLWGPLGTVICFGLMISMVLTLFILPVLYWLVCGSDRTAHKKFHLKKIATAILLMALLLPAQLQAQSRTLSVDSCKQLALKNNKKIMEADFEVQASQEVKKNAYTHYFPKVSASAFSMRSTDYLVKGTIPEMNLPVYDGNPANLAHATQFAYFPSMEINAIDYLNMASVSATMPIYAGGQVKNGNKLASIGVEVSRQQQAMTSTEVLVRTEQLYWTIVSLNEKLKTLDSYQALLDTLNRDVTNFNKAGLAQRNDLLKVELKQNELQSNRLKLMNGLSLSKRALCQQMGIKYDSTLVLTDPPLVASSVKEALNESEAITGRKEYQLLNNAKEAEKLQLKMTKGELKPQLALGAMAAYVDIANSGNSQQFAFASLNIPISEWWGGSHKIKQQQLNIEKAQNKLNETSELLALQIAQAENELEEQYDQVQLAEKAIEQARENLKVTDDNYRSGTIGISDLLEAQVLFQTTNDQLTNSRCNLQIAKAHYLQAIGKFE